MRMVSTPACCVVYVHATGTTKMHECERRDFEYAQRCMQCRKVLVANDRVAAHVVAYPLCCCNCCVGRLVLKTSCKSCNAHNRTGKWWVDKESAYITLVSWYATLQTVHWPCCLHYDAR